MSSNTPSHMTPDGLFATTDNSYLQGLAATNEVTVPSPPNLLLTASHSPIQPVTSVLSSTSSAQASAASMAFDASMGVVTTADSTAMLLSTATAPVLASDVTASSMMTSLMMDPVTNSMVLSASPVAAAPLASVPTLPSAVTAEPNLAVAAAAAAVAMDMSVPPFVIPSSTTSATMVPNDMTLDKDASEKNFSFVSLAGQRKRPRRRYDEIERLYHCTWPGCTKSYGTLNHLNAHVTMQKHGPKRHPSEFKEMRKTWRRQKKEREAVKKAAEKEQQQLLSTAAASASLAAASHPSHLITSMAPLASSSLISAAAPLTTVDLLNTPAMMATVPSTINALLPTFPASVAPVNDVAMTMVSQPIYTTANALSTQPLGGYY